MERTIKVTGKGKLNVKPDTIQLNLSLHGTKETYEQAMELSAQQTGLLRDCLTELGFERSDLKTLSFQVDAEYESYQDKSRTWKHRFVGYKFSHSMKFAFPADNLLLGKVLSALAHSSANPEFHILYTVKDPESVKEELLAAAVADSKRKAECLANAAGIKLGQIVTIDYSWEEITIASAPMKRVMSAGMELQEEALAYETAIEPDDIKVSDTVTVLWTIA